MDEDYKEIVKKISKLQKEYDEDMEEDSQDIKEEESENLEGLLEFSGLLYQIAMLSPYSCHNL